MQLKTAIRAAIGVAALAVCGTAMAQTNLNDTTGDVFLNIVNTSNNTSFLYDTDLTQAQFSSTGNYSFTLSGATYSQFLAAAGGSLASSNIDYSVYSATSAGGTGGGPEILFSTNSALNSAAGAFEVTKAEGELSAFLQGANANNSATTPVAGTAILAGLSSFNTPTTEAAIQNLLLTVGGVDSAAAGTALNFFETSNTGGRTQNYNGVTQEANTWTLSTAGVLTYGSATTPVPLPTPLLLMLSGLGFMGVVARRSKAA
jgi:hypothetical protein